MSSASSSLRERCAAIDVGTNSVLLTIAERHGHEVVPVLERATVTRLGEGVDRTGKLRAEAVARTMACLDTYRGLLDTHHVQSLAVVGTSALRDAAHGDDFVIQASLLLGTQLQVVSGQREAELTFRGALSGLHEEGRFFVFDIGGGSTELIWGTHSDRFGAHRPLIERSVSLNLGSVRLHERFGLGDPPDATQLLEMQNHVRGELEAYLPDPGTLDPVRAIVGVAGTVTSLAALCMGLEQYDARRVHGSICRVEDLARLQERLGQMTLEQRLALPGLGAGRADVIVSGAVLCRELLQWFGATEIIASDRGVRFGLLEELFTARPS